MGHKPNSLCISGEPNINSGARDVVIVDRIVGGNVIGKGASLVVNFFKTTYTPAPLKFLGLHAPPNPANHWGVKVGDYLHQLQAEDNKIFYQSVKYDHWGGYDEYKVGQTTMNDAAIQSAGIQAIAGMPEDYELVHNNCQKFVIELLNKICLSGREKVRTSYSLTKAQMMFVPGTEDVPEEEQGKEVEVEVATAEDPAAMEKLLADVQQIMEENTPPLTEAEVEEALKQADATEES